ncbi:MAG: hypothetical protein V4541_13870 [Bacteroidota bacterium]
MSIVIIKPAFCIAQDLPNVQEKGIRTPSGLKIDGKAVEVNNDFQAYNKSTYLFYTLTNDDENFYLVIQSQNIGINNKIMSCGITFMVKADNRRNEKDGISITFPAITKNYLVNRNKPAMNLTNYGNEDNEKKKSKATKSSSNRIIDSITYLRQKAYLTQVKEIGLSGIKEISTPVISIYNDKNINAKITISNNNILTYELAVPLKYFRLTINKPKEIAYQISLNELKGLSGGLPSRLVVEGTAARTTGLGGIDQRLLSNRLYFWGSYTLAK